MVETNGPTGGWPPALGIDTIVEPDSLFYGVIGEGCREAQSAHRRVAPRRPASAIVRDERDWHERRMKRHEVEV